MKSTSQETMNDILTCCISQISYKTCYKRISWSYSKFNLGDRREWNEGFSRSFDRYNHRFRT